MSAGRELNAAEITNLLAQPEKKPRTSRSKGPDYDNRTINGWFKLPHHFQEEDECTVPAHDETPNAYAEVNAPKDQPILRSTTATTVIGDLKVCRYCFLTRKDQVVPTDI